MEVLDLVSWLVLFVSLILTKVMEILILVSVQKYFDN